MKRQSRILAAVGILVLIASTAAIAQQGGQGGGGRTYDPKKVVTVHGVVVSVEKVGPVRGWWNFTGVHLVLRVGKTNVSVHLGPSWYVDRQDVKVRAKDRIEVVGWNVTVNKTVTIIAAEVTKGGKVLELRDKKTGVPVWSHGRGGGGGGRGGGRGGGMGPQSRGQN